MRWKVFENVRIYLDINTAYAKTLINMDNNIKRSRSETSLYIEYRPKLKVKQQQHEITILISQTSSSNSDTYISDVR